MVFKKGEVGNPLGAGTIKRHQTRLAAKLLTPHMEKAVVAIVDALENGEPHIKLAAAKLVMEYVCGKPATSLELNSEGDTNIKINVNIIKNA